MSKKSSCMTRESPNSASAGHLARCDSRNLLTIAELGVESLRLLLDRATEFARGPRSPSHRTILAGRVVANLFFEDSTRTRNSFTLAARALGADVLEFSAADSSLNKGESLLDTVRTIEALGVDALVVRHGSSGAPQQIARALRIPVLNAGDGRHAHPTQALLDVLTLRRRWTDISGKRVAIVGDVMNSRVARSTCEALRMLGATVTFVGPVTLAPPSLRILGADVTASFDTVLPTADALIMLRVQNERIAGAAFPSIREYAWRYQLNESRLANCKAEVLVLHPGPMNRGVEISPEVADGPHSLIFDQVAAGVAARMAALEWCLTGR